MPIHTYTYPRPQAQPNEIERLRGQLAYAFKLIEMLAEAINLNDPEYIDWIGKRAEEHSGDWRDGV